jgi:hypothetical protein
MKAKPLFVGLLVAAVLGCIALISYVTYSRGDTSLEFQVQDSVSNGWVWNAAMRLQDRVMRGYYQSDAGLKLYRFTHLKPGRSTLTVDAPGYETVSKSLVLTKGRNRFPGPIIMRGLQLPHLRSFAVFERLSGSDVAVQLRPIGEDGQALVNHPCLDIRIGCKVFVQLKNGVPIQQPVDSGSSKGRRLFQGIIPWRWDSSPEAVFRYSAVIPAEGISADDSDYRIIDYIVLIPDPLKITATELDGLTGSALKLDDDQQIIAFLDREKGRVKYFLERSFGVKARE